MAAERKSHMWHTLLLGGLWLALALPEFAAASDSHDTRSARNLAAACNTCHAPHAGEAGQPASLYGADKNELIRKMREFRGGARPATLMQQIAKGYTEQETEQIAAWFSAQAATPKP
jgi:sulfide dehydrogenase cytochrome subunit